MGNSAGKAVSPAAYELLQAAERGDVRALSSAADAVPSVDTPAPPGPPSFGRTALIAAAGRGQVEAVRFLISRGAYVGAVDGEGMTALMAGAASGHPDVVKQLLLARAATNAKSRAGRTALIYACVHTKAAAADVLCTAGAAVAEVDPVSGHTPLEMAVTASHDALVDVLLRNGAKVSGKAIMIAHTPAMRAKLQAAHSRAEGVLVSRSAGTVPGGAISATPTSRSGDGLPGTVLLPSPSTAAPTTTGAVISAPPAPATGVVPAKGEVRQPAPVPAAITQASTSLVGGPGSVRGIDFKEVELGDSPRILGRGTYGTVYAGTWRFMRVAVKVLSDGDALPETLVAELRAEAHIQHPLRHANVVTVYGLAEDATRTPVRYALIMAYAGRGALQQRLADSSCELPLATRMALIRGIAAGLAYLHSERVVHGDVKSLNVLLDDADTPMLCDFGFAAIKSAARTGSLASARVSPSTFASAGTGSVAGSGASGGGTTVDLKGSLRWMAPEQLTYDPSAQGYADVSFATDVYAFGITAWEVLSRSVPYDQIRGLVDPAFQLPGLLASGVRPSLTHPNIPEGVPLVVSALIAQCWATKPRERPSMAHVVRVLESTV